jgi:hypothetical protein
VHIFGHIHVGRGVPWIRWDAMQMTYEEVCARRVRRLVSFIWQKMEMYFWAKGRYSIIAYTASVGDIDNQLLGAIAIEICELLAFL